MAIKQPNVNLLFWIFVGSITALILYQRNKTIQDLADSTIGAALDTVNSIFSRG